ncbi:Hoc large outer capsid [Escherichia phage RB43]|uniref:Hoc large outer capsid n=1 Tax=Escherichia phage RB43 TaxID=2887182 RepID=Q56BG2_9CAUD|nr:Hoc-like head decoration [Escherichia phage RB43]AAX78759.1 Hoc large outer capsid [Escherichia phage RB43]
MATEKWTTVHPIPWRNTSFTYLPWWIYDIIVAANTAGGDWRDYAEEKYAKEFVTLKQAYID